MHESSLSPRLPVGAMIFANSEGVASLARCATVAQPRLCAASTTGPGALRTAARMRSIQSACLGVSQFSCSTRQVCLRSRSQYVCQWSEAEVRARRASAPDLLLLSDLAFSKCSAYQG